jgi:hypothetical protein
MSKMISIEDLYTRDNGICGICKKRIKKISHANRDHIVPVSLGGCNKQANLRIAHVECNKRRGNEQPTKTMQDVLAEVGEAKGWTCSLCSDTVENDWEKTALFQGRKEVAHRTCIEIHYRALASAK